MIVRLAFLVLYEAEKNYESSWQNVTVEQPERSWRFHHSWIMSSGCQKNVLSINYYK